MSAGGRMEVRPQNKFEIGNRFIGFRKKSFLTQARLANIIKISRQTISKIESGLVTPHHKTWSALIDLEAKHQEAQKVCLPTRWL
jgi:DNA-binding XRE family transcriptional regulator